MYNDIKFDCIHFEGHIPCKPNKERNKECASCDEYVKPEKRILIIKLAAIGDVIRTTPLLTRYRKMYPTAHFTWITNFPDVLPKKEINKIYKFDFKSAYTIQNQQYDIALNLDKDPEACILLSEVNATEKYGFIWKDGHLAAATEAAQHKIVTGLYDGVSIKNTKHYLEEIFEICHLDFQDEPYSMNLNENLAKKWTLLREKAGNRKIIGLNTGCGKRWLTRLWPEEYWVEFIQKLQEKDYYPVILGGADEDIQNKIYAEKTGAYYPGTYSLEEFIAMSSNLDIVVTQVSMMMHIAVALKVPMLLFNNIFNKHEFYLYNRGVILEPESGCDCYFGNSCKRDRSCMYDLHVETALKEIDTLAAKL